MCENYYLRFVYLMFIYCIFSLNDITHILSVYLQFLLIIKKNNS